MVKTITKKSIGLSMQKMLIILAVFIALLILPQFLSENHRAIGVRILLYILLAGSMNIINGYTGQFTIGQVGFANIGAYVTAILMTNYGVSFWIAVVLSGLAACLMGALISYPTRKLSGLYLAVVTLGFSEIARVVALNWNSVTGGALGIKGIPSPELFGYLMRGPLPTYYLVISIAAIMLICNYCVVHSKIGRAWISIRENEAAAASLGINTYFYKMINFVYGAFWAGVAGAIMAIFYRYIDSTMFTLEDNFNVLAMMILGGQGTMLGPVVGSLLVNGVLEVFRFTAVYRQVAYGAAIILMMWLRPQGILGKGKNHISLYTRISKRYKSVSKGGGA